MAHRHVLTVALFIVLLLMSTTPIAAQSTADIQSFSSTFSTVGYDALANRTARIPVSWTTSNRPLTANLVFEQVFSDGSTINVELPRLIVFVASNGNGIAAPILPEDGSTQIRLRVSLVNMFTNFVYDTEEIVLTIIEGNGGGSGEGSVPAITSFSANYSAPINRTELDNGTVRIPVQWRAINRPLTANLVFEQVLNDGSIVNVELPRNFLWVNSADSGIVAPVSVADNVTQIALRVRLVSLLTDTTLDQRYFYVPIQSVNNNPPVITTFSTTTSSVTAAFINGTLIDVHWSVSNRPANSNLVFEQILPDGTIRNAELPRHFVIVPSSGDGIVAPFLRTGQPQPMNLVFRLRLIDLSNQSTLASEQIEIPVIYGNENEQETDLSISNFSVEQNDSQLTFSWNIDGDFREANIVWRPVDNQITVHEPQSNTGTHAYTLPQDYRAGEHTFTLTLEDEFGTSLSAEATLHIPCAYEWGFEVDESDCPESALISRTGAYQDFQRGFMVWNPAFTQSMWVFYDDGTAARYTDDWNNADYTIEGTPSEGTFAPERGFGYLWSTTPEVRSGLGWAITDEQSYTVNSQERINLGTTSQQVIYFTLPDDTIIRINRGNSDTNMTWETVQ